MMTRSEPSVQNTPPFLLDNTVAVEGSSYYQNDALTTVNIHATSEKSES
jgi:hypothetical protein